MIQGVRCIVNNLSQNIFFGAMSFGAMSKVGQRVTKELPKLASGSAIQISGRSNNTEKLLSGIACTVSFMALKAEPNSLCMNSHDRTDLQAKFDSAQTRYEEALQKQKNALDAFEVARKGSWDPELSPKIQEALNEAQRELTQAGHDRDDARVALDALPGKRDYSKFNQG